MSQMQNGAHEKKNIQLNNRDLEQIISEKNDLERALSSVTDILQNTVAEKDQLSKLFNDFKLHFNNIKNQCSSYQNRLVEEITARKSQEQDSEQRIEQMRNQLESKQKEIDFINQKMQLPVDQDILRMRIQKDLENKYRFELDSKVSELEKLSQNYFEIKKLHELQKSQNEYQKQEYEQALQSQKQRHQQEIQELVNDNLQLKLKFEDQARDKDQTRQLRRDIDDLKRRLCDEQQESIDLRKERDHLKIEKNELIIKNAKDVEEERNNRRTLQSENDKIRFQVKCLEDDVSKLQLKCERKIQEVLGIHSEKSSLLSIHKEKEIMIDSLRRQLQQSKEDFNLKEQELDAYMRRAVSEDKDKSLLERKEKTKIHKELEILEKNYVELSHQRKSDLALKQNEIDNLNKIIEQLEKLKTKNVQQIDNNEADIRDLKKKVILKNDQYEILEKEFQVIQERYRESQKIEFNLSTVKEQQDATLKIQEDQIQKLQQKYQEDDNQWKLEKQELSKQIQELYIQLHNMKRESMNQNQQLKQKYSDYKQKVKQANQQINILASRLAQSELLLNQMGVGQNIIASAGQNSALERQSSQVSNQNY